jgi:hypothetical protein
MKVIVSRLTSIFGMQSVRYRIVQQIQQIPQVFDRAIISKKNQVKGYRIVIDAIASRNSCADTSMEISPSGLG